MLTGANCPLFFFDSWGLEGCSAVFSLERWWEHCFILGSPSVPGWLPALARRLFSAMARFMDFLTCAGFVDGFFFPEKSLSSSG